jgi:2-methylcitrate dehydratase PrpD
MKLARYAASTSGDRIPEHVRERAKQVILDELASSTLGRRSLGGDLAARYAATLGGAQESLILGTHLRVSAQHAALANGTAGHGEEVDGAHVIGGHPGATLVHATVAVAEKQRASGAELLNALVLAYDVGVRMVAACGNKFAVKDRHHLYADFLYAVGAAVGSSRLLGLDPLKICHAMALVTFQTNALACLFAEKRHVSKSFCNGQFSHAGVSAAMMAVAGLEGVEDVLGMKDGLLEAWGAEGGADVVVRQLGEDWSVMGANFKFINAGYPIHTCVEAATTLVAQDRIPLDAIASIHIGMPEKALRVVDSREMHNICVQDMVTAAVVQGGLSLRELPFPAMLQNPAYQQLRAKVTAGVDPDVNREFPNGRGTNVTVRRQDGTARSLRIDHPRGHSQRGGVTWDDLAAKWKDGLPNHDIARAITLASRLEELEDVRELVNVFHGSPE